MYNDNIKISRSNGSQRKVIAQNNNILTEKDNFLTIISVQNIISYSAKDNSYLKKIEIFDLYGNRIYTEQINDNVKSKQFDASKLKEGIYITIVYDNNGKVTTKKILISK